MKVKGGLPGRWKGKGKGGERPGGEYDQITLQASMDMF
jgi:hypothetical protein